MKAFTLAGLLAVLCAAQAKAQAVRVANPPFAGSAPTVTSITASATPGFIGNGSGLTNVLPHTSSDTFVNITTGTVVSSYTFTSNNVWVYLATATVSGTRAGEDMFTPSAVSLGSTGTSTTFCCGIFINGAFPAGESYRCQQFSNTQSEIVLNPLLAGVGTATSTNVAIVCSVSQIVAGYQQIWSVRVSGIGL